MSSGRTNRGSDIFSQANFKTGTSGFCSMEETGIKKSGQYLNAVDDAVWKKKTTVGRHDSKTVRFLSKCDAVLEVPSQLHPLQTWRLQL